ncbi:MAG: aldo/keto reductase [Verrucomicrobiota bacterium JB022]|nr:aldo/keto reductase [Verrucomicrobiota bacterium JB022]
MQRRIFDHLGTPVSEIGLGCWQLGGDFGQNAPRQAEQILRTAVEQGITFFDTADVYGAGESEKFVGKVLNELGRERFFIASKVGRTGDLYPDQYTEAKVRAHVEESLQRLQIDTLDLIQLHCIPNEVVEQGEIFQWLRRLKEEGKIRSFGASVESMDDALSALKQRDLSSLQIIFNIFRQKPVERVLEMAHQQGVAIIVRLPLASGLLSGKMRYDTRFEEQDHRHYNRDGAAFNVGETFAGLPFEQGVELADQLKAYVPNGYTMAQFAQRWILDQPSVTTIITGASRPDQVVANAAVSHLPPLSPTLHAQLATFYQQRVVQHIRGPY